MTMGAEGKNMKKTPVRICSRGYLIVAKEM
jgi:hypothetical protein